MKNSPNPGIIQLVPRWLKPVFFTAIVLFALALAWLLLSSIAIRAQPYKRAETVEATSNARQIGLDLFEFETEYGSFPNKITASLVTVRNPAHSLNLSGSSSNALFRQLYASYKLLSERRYYANISGSRLPDGDTTPEHILESGEVGFSYISGLSLSDDPTTPIVLTPVIPGTTKFDPKPFDGKAVVLHIDNSVRTYDIKKDGHIYRNGINLLSSKHPIWKGKAPDIRYPE